MTPNFVEKFLELNGFKEEQKDSYKKNNCIVIFWDDYYSVDDGAGVVYSPDLNIYWLIGYLTYHNYIDKDYKIPE